MLELQRGNMENYLSLLKQNPLFEGITIQDMPSLIDCLNGRVKDVRKDEFIFRTQDPVTFIGLVISGSVKVIREDMQGKDNLLTEIIAGELFGEVFACAEIEHSPVSVVASCDSEILLLDYRKVIDNCGSACSFHAKLTENMLKIMARKNLMLNRKIEILSKRTTRQRLLSYFMELSNGSQHFTIPLDREELAAYLCVERSAMSAELSRMQKDGLIRYHRNTVELLNRNY